MAKVECVTLFPEVETVTRKLSDEQFGILIRAVIAYRFRGEVYEGEDDRVDLAFAFLSNQVDREMEARRKKALAAEARWEKNAKECSVMQEDAKDAPIQSIPIQSDPIHSDPLQSNPVQSQNTQKEIKRDKKIRESNGAGAPASPGKKSYGKFGWVKLSQQEYDALKEELGETELKRCIDYLDESAQTTGNKNRWRDFGLVIQRCSREGWGLSKREQEKIREMNERMPIYGIIL